MAALGRTDALDDAIGFQISQMLFYRFGGDAQLLGQSRSTQLAVFREQSYDFLPTICGFFPTFLCFLPTFLRNVKLYPYICKVTKITRR